MAAAAAAAPAPGTSSGGAGGTKVNQELWYACAGPLVSLPPAGSLVVYFPQGHSEQVAASMRKDADAKIPSYPNLPSKLICILRNVNMLADPDTDEVYARMTLQPVSNVTHCDKETLLASELALKQTRPQTEFFCKTLTASDTSTHGGFSVPRRAAERIFPHLDFSMQPPAQELQARDLHDAIWTFRHIYRGQPKRHLLTTGWSLLVSGKRLIAGDSVLFIRDGRQQLLLGIRRANRQPVNLSSSVLSSDSMHIGILAAAAHAAANNSQFTVFYNPRASPSEFVIPFAKYQKAVYSNQLSLGMRFRMMFETEESATRRYMGTITGISDMDPVRWKNSEWRNIQVAWDEAASSERRTRVSFWEVEPIIAPFFIYPSPLFTAKRPRQYGITGELPTYVPIAPRPVPIAPRSIKRVVDDVNLEASSPPKKLKGAAEPSTNIIINGTIVLLYEGDYEEETSPLERRNRERSVSCGGLGAPLPSSGGASSFSLRLPPLAPSAKGGLGRRRPTPSASSTPTSSPALPPQSAPKVSVPPLAIPLMGAASSLGQPSAMAATSSQSPPIGLGSREDILDAFNPRARFAEMFGLWTDMSARLSFFGSRMEAFNKEQDDFLASKEVAKLVSEMDALKAKLESTEEAKTSTEAQLRELQKSHVQLQKDVETMKESMRSSYNREHEAMTIITTLQAQLKESEERWSTFWAFFVRVFKLLRRDDDEGSWVDLLPSMPGRFEAFAREAGQMCARMTLGRIRALAPTLSLEPIISTDLDFIERAESLEHEVDALATQMADLLDINVPSGDEEEAGGEQADVGDQEVAMKQEATEEQEPGEEQVNYYAPNA